LCEDEIESGFICEDCLEEFVEIGPPLCPNCGRPKKKQCGCRDTHLDWIRGWVYYQPPVDRLIQEFKYHNKPSLAKFLGRKMAAVIRGDPHYHRIDLVVPIPLHPRRRWERGYNQSELLARAVGKELGLLVDNPLIRVRDNPSQTGLTETERKKNVAGIFEVKGGMSGKVILLVDDVMTTGATIEEGARVLKEAGALAVLGAVVAIAP